MARKPEKKIRFDVGLLPTRSVGEVAELAVVAEEAGFGGVWVADSQSVFRDAWATLALCADRTQKIQLATGVTNPITRHPAVLAGNIATLNELSGGRAILGMGRGESAVYNLGLKPATIQEWEERALTVRALLRGDTTRYQGHEIRMAWPVSSVPIFFAASGPKALQSAGKVADGVLFQVGSEPSLIEYALENVRKGADAAGRNFDEIQLFARLACNVGPDRARAREEVKGYGAVAAGTVFSSVPREVFPEPLWLELKEMKGRYDYYQHGSSDAPHNELVTDRILDSIAIAGTPEEAVSRFQEIVRLGVDGFVIPITSSEPKVLLSTLSDEVFPGLS
jgi:5,10-methylenetetrahydromethanopterin reductase